jgi:acetyltransferase-like isoleucine patch superfamily enzyme
VLIGSYAFLAHEVVIADDFAAVPWRPGADSTAPAPQTGPSVVLGDDVWIGARATLLKGARIGSGAVVGAGTVVDFEVPAGAVVAGSPARIVGRAGR